MFLNAYVHRPRQTMAVLLAFVAGAFIITGCSSSQSETATSPTPSATASGNVYGSAPAVDPPGPNEVVLDVQGADGQSRSYTLQQLRDLPSQTITIEEPFVNKEQTFVGVPMADLFQQSGIPTSATVDTVALNDYSYAAPVTTFTDSQALLAYTVDGRDIPMAEGGPIRIVFPAGTPGYANLDAWNWSLRTISQQ